MSKGITMERIAEIREELRLNAEQAATPAPWMMMPVDEVSALLDIAERAASQSSSAEFFADLEGDANVMAVPGRKAVTFQLAKSPHCSCGIPTTTHDVVCPLFIEESEVDMAPVGDCSRCGIIWYTHDGYCGGCGR